MCGPFTRDLRHAPAGLIKHLQEQQALQQLQQPATYYGTVCDGFIEQPVSQDTSLTSELGLDLPQKIQPDPVSGLGAEDSAFFNWSLLDEAFPGTDMCPPVASSPSDTTEQSPILVGLETGFQCHTIPEVPRWTAVQGVADVTVQTPPSEASTPVPSLPKTVVVKNEKSDRKRPAPKAKRPPKPVAKPSSDSSGMSDKDTEHATDSKPYSEKLPKELLDHPCAATLLSAGIRIKGRTREELLDVAERIKKRRRASAARCRARKASHVHTLEDENDRLKEENMLLRQRIAELTGGSSLDFTNILSMDTVMDTNVGSTIGIPMGAAVF